MQQADYKSPEFYRIIDNINKLLILKKLAPISAIDGKIIKSKYSVGKYGNTYIWRITNYTCPQLLLPKVIDDLSNYLKEIYPQYIADKTIRFANPKYSKSILNDKPIASIVILLTELPDNIITRQDLMEFMSGDAQAINKCLEIESRMFKRSDDTRDPVTRIEDFAFSLIYEPKLVAANLKNISDLTLKHQTEVVTLETDTKTDFNEVINNIVYNIEGKSTRASIKYDDTEVGHSEFADYFKDRLESGSLGSIHNADYILFVIKQTGQVICINTIDYTDNWLAGSIKL